MASRNSPGHLYASPTPGVQLPSLSKRTVSPNTRLSYQSSRLTIGAKPNASGEISTSQNKSYGATLKGFNLSMAIAHDDTKRSASFQSRRRSALTTSLANMGSLGTIILEQDRLQQLAFIRFALVARNLNPIYCLPIPECATRIYAIPLSLLA